MNLEYIPDGVPDAPLILFWGGNNSECRELFDALMELRLEAKDVAIHELPGVTGNIQLYARTGDENCGVRKIGNTFHWENTSDGWETISCLLSPFCELLPARGCFQRLCDAGDIRVIVSDHRGW